MALLSVIGGDERCAEPDWREASYPRGLRQLDPCSAASAPRECSAAAAVSEKIARADGKRISQASIPVAALGA